MSSLFFRPSGSSSGSGGSGGSTTGLKFIGNYNASTNTPDLTQVSLQNIGDLYIVTVEGTQDLGTGSTLFSVSDNIYWSDGKWNKLQSTVLAEEVIYNTSNVADALDGLDNRIDDLEANPGVSDAIDVSYSNVVSGLTTTNVQDAIDELDGIVDTLSLNSKIKLTTVLNIYLAPSESGGNDTNDGLTVSTPKRTISALLTLLEKYNFNGQIITVNLATGSYTWNSNYTFSNIDLNGGVLEFIGVGINNSILNGSISSTSILFSNYGYINFNNLSFNVLNLNLINNLSYFNFTDVRFNSTTATSSLVAIVNNSSQTIFTNCYFNKTVSSADYIVSVLNNSGIINFGGNLTIESNSNNNFINVDNSFVEYLATNTSTGILTGRKFDLINNSKLEGDLNNIPGTGLTFGINSNYNGINYNNTNSNLIATNTQDAIDEVSSKVKNNILTRLENNTTYYVDPTGNNSNDGLTNITPWATIQYAIDWVAQNINLNGYQVTIQLANGTYPENPITAKDVVGFGEFSTYGVLIIGNTSDPTQVVLNGSFITSSNIPYRLEGVKFIRVDGGALQALGVGTTLYCGNIHYHRTGTGGTFSLFLFTQRGALIEFSNGSSISLAGRINHFLYSQVDGNTIVNNCTITIEDNVAGRSSFVRVERDSQFNVSGCTFVNPSNWASNRFQITSNAFIFTGTNNLSYLPGTVAGYFGNTPTSGLHSASGHYDKYTHSDLWAVETLSSNLNLNPVSIPNRVMTATVTRTVTLPTIEPTAPYEFWLINSSSSTANINISDGTATIRTLTPGQSIRVYRENGTDWRQVLVTPVASDLNYSNSTSSLTATTVQAAIDEISTKLLSSKTNRQTLTANLTLTNTSPGIQHLLVNNSSFNTVVLPASPLLDSRFIIKNNSASTFNLVVTGQANLIPGEIWEGVYDGVEWLVI